jgi:hypothetical protein
MTDPSLKRQTISLDVERLIKKALEGDNLAVLFETELQKKLIEPIFKKVTEEVTNTDINLSKVDLNGIFTKAIADIRLDSNTISNLNTAFSDKINSLTTSINGISIDNIRRDFEQNVTNSLKDKFKEIKVQSPKQIETKDLLYFLTGGRIKLDYISAYRIGEATVSLVDKLTDGIKNIELDIKKDLGLKDLIKILINPKYATSTDVQTRYNTTVSKFLDILDKDIESFKLQDLKPLTHEDIINILLDTKPANSAVLRKEYEDIINSLSTALETMSGSLTDSSITTLNKPRINTDTKTSDKLDNLADYNSNLEDAVFTSKEFTLSIDTLKKIKEDNLLSYKEGDLTTNTVATDNTTKIIAAFNNLSEKIENIADTNTKDSSTDSIFDKIKEWLGSRKSSRNRPTGNRPSRSRGPGRTQASRPSNRTSSPSNRPTARTRAAGRPRPSSPAANTSQTGNRPPTTPQRAPIRRPASTRSASNNTSSAPRTARPARIPSAAVTRVGKALNTISKGAGILGTAATIGVGAYKYNEINTDIKDGLMSKEDGTREKSKIVGEATGSLMGGVAGGAAAGALAGVAGGPFAPITVPIAAIVGGVLGALGGGWVGEKSGEKVADKFLIPEEAKKASPSIEEKAEQIIKDSKKNQNIDIAPATTTDLSPQPSKVTTAELLPVSSSTTDLLGKKISLSTTSTENSAEMFATASKLNFDPLISFLDKKFESLGLNLGLLHNTLVTASNQSPINIINNEGDQVVENTNSGYNNDLFDTNGFDSIEATRQAFRLS